METQKYSFEIICLVKMCLPNVASVERSEEHGGPVLVYSWQQFVDLGKEVSDGDLSERQFVLTF